MVGDQAENGRHDAESGVCAGHLYSDDGLRLIRAEMFRGGMNDAGIDRGAAKPDKDKAANCRGLPKGQEQQKDAK